MRWRWSALVLLVAAGASCSSDDKEDAPPSAPIDTGTSDSPYATDTGRPDETRFAAVTCAPQAGNALRYDCAVDLGEAAPVTLELWPADDTSAVTTRSSSTPGVDHALVLWGLRPGTAYEWQALAEYPDGTLPIAGGFTTGSLPADVDIVMEIEGKGTAEHVLFSFGCELQEFLVIADRDGNVVWYQDLLPFSLSTPPVVINAVHVTPTGTILAMHNQEGVVEIGLDGSLHYALSAAEGDFDKPVHHDVFRTDDLTWVLTADSVVHDDTEFVVDGFQVFDGTGTRVAEWTTDAVLEPVSDEPVAGGYWAPDFPDAVDWSHANSIFVDDDLSVYLSMRHVDAVIAVRGDIGSPDFGALEWTLVGDPLSELSGDFALASTTGATADLVFQRQHHATTTPAGTLMLFDNKASSASDSRVVELDVDPVGLVADIVAEYPLGAWCPTQGSAYPLADGGVVATCPLLSTIVELRAGEATPTWELSADCAYGPVRFPMSRGIPVDIDP